MLTAITGSSSSTSSSSLVDALPYVDAGYDNAGVREAVLALVEEEMKVYRPTKDYLAHLPPLNLTSFQTDLMKVEMERMEKSLPMEKLDFKKYTQFKPPVNRRKDPMAWEEGFHRVAILHTHMANRLSNLQLQLDYGAEIWRRFNPTMERQFKSVDGELKAIRNRIQEVNWERKNSQLAAGSKLHELEASWVAMIVKNFQIERSCLELEATIANMERAAAAKASLKASSATVPDNSDGQESTENLSRDINEMDISKSDSINESMEVQVGSQP